jgi:uncharacterized protein YjbI with pentapeptide repeats
MELINLSELAFAPLLAGKVRFPSYSLTLIAKGTFDMKPDGTLSPVEEQPLPTGDLPYETDSEGESVRFPSDFVHFKPKADVLVVGHAHTPGGKPLPKVQAGFQVGPLVKTLSILGNRIEKPGLLSSSITRPESFRKMEISFQNAFGGGDFKKNPLGKGQEKVDLPGIGKIYQMPNIEHSQSTDAKIKKEYPAGFGPIPMTWPQRMALSGTYGKQWLSERWPHFPKDFDWTYFNSAPPDQRMPSYLKGDETACFTNLHPDHPDYKTKLPGLRVRCFLEKNIQTAPVFQEVSMNLDTVWVDMDNEKMTLVWRGVADVRDEMADEVHRVLLATEPLDGPKASTEEYRTKLSAELEARRVEEIESFEPEVDEKSPEEEPHIPPPPAPIRRGEILSRIKRGEGFAGEDLTGADLYRMNLAGVDFSGAILPRADFSHSDLSGADFSGANLGDSLLRGVTARKTNFAGADMNGAELQEADLDGANFTGTDLSYAILKKASLEEIEAKKSLWAVANLSEARMKKANLEEADLSGAILYQADLSGANLKLASLKNVRARGIQAQKINLTEADLTGANLAEGNLEEAVGPGSVWEDAKCFRGRFPFANFEKSDFSGAYLEGTDFSCANLRHARMAGAILRGADMTRVNLFLGSLEKADLTGANLREANLYEAEFYEAKTDKTVLDGANVKMTKLA